MDIVIPVRNGEENEELRYTLRSIQQYYKINKPTIWIVGYQPSWLKNIEFIQGNHPPLHKWRPIVENLQIFANHPNTPNKYIIWNDDIFLQQNYTKPTNHNRLSSLTNTPQTLAEQSKYKYTQTPTNSWHESLQITMTALNKTHNLFLEDILSWETHTPWYTTKKRQQKTTNYVLNHPAAKIPQWRTIEAHLNKLKPTQPIKDNKYLGGKILTEEDLQKSYLSTEDFHYRQYIPDIHKTLYPNPSQWEN